ncbi:MAG: cobyric acid synthase [Ilumatobacteraceae bacterium]
MRPLIVLGCTSDAGKSLVAAALCRWFARQGVQVAPFKAQNMSNNARVVPGPDGGAGEIGVAQWLQARAAGVEPDVRMNPVLLKPEADTQSQVIVRGRVDQHLTRMHWEDRHDALWAPMCDSLGDLQREFDLVVIEGAGSPAEINLRDQVNNRITEHADARALLVSDIDRGGSFAHLHGTWSLVPEATQSRLEGFVLNKFRGDAALLAPGPEKLTAMTGMRHLATLPLLEHDLPREEGANDDGGRIAAEPDAPRVVLPRFPYGSNLDEFRLLNGAARVEWTASSQAFERLNPVRDLIVLPGSKHVAADLQWMRDHGLDQAIDRAHAAGVRIVGICGGAMMMGQHIVDEFGVEGGRPSIVDGLGLLPYATVMGSEKLVRRRQLVLDEMGGRWCALNGRRVDGYEIRFGAMTDGGAERAAWTDGNVFASLCHGLFEDRSFAREVLGVDVHDPLEETFELLADAVEEHFDTDWLATFVP